MSWHGYEDGEKVALNEIIAKCEARIRSNAVKAKERKQEYLQQIRNCGKSFLKYKPGTGAWGNSPLNPNNWRTLDGKPIGRASSASEDTTPHE